MPKKIQFGLSDGLRLAGREENKTAFLVLG
jgi:hypothetical protein